MMTLGQFQQRKTANLTPTMVKKQAIFTQRNAALWLVIFVSVIFWLRNVFFVKNESKSTEQLYPLLQLHKSKGERHSTVSRGREYHLVFSTGCNAYQDWQSYMFFYHVWKAGQVGNVTRIASGCQGPQATALRKQHAQQIQEKMSQDFQLWLTPDYGNSIPRDNYKFFNKPMGLRHWMKHHLRMPNSQYDDTVFVILDPDEFLVRPFTDDYSMDKFGLAQESLLANETVRRGQPFAAYYGLGGNFLSKLPRNVSLLFGESVVESPLSRITPRDMHLHYAAGPPYVVVGADVWPLVDTWAKVAVPVRQYTVNHVSEMFAYMVAAAHLQLPHRLSTTFMLSNVGMEPIEYWGWVDSMENVCELQQLVLHSLPHTLHFCQEYVFDHWYFLKYYLPPEVLSCDHALLREPNAELGHLAIQQDDRKEVLLKKRHAFMLCQLIPRVNDAAVHYKKHHCPAGGANYDETTTLKMPFRGGGGRE